MRTDGWRRGALIAVGIGIIPFLLLPGRAYLTDPGTLAALILLELILAALWRYNTRFFLVLLGAFLWAGIPIPFGVAWSTGRWFVLAIAALAGCILYLKERQLHLTAFHFAAFICAGTALVSAQVSAYPRVALLKSLSLALLFLYSATGARLGALGREREFLHCFMIGCEAMVYVAATAYFGFHYPLLGNPNSLGAVMGVVAVPVFLWGILSSEDRALRVRFTFAVVVALLLLFSSYARAGIMAATSTSLLLCLTLRRYRVLMKGICLALLLATLAAALLPREDRSAGSLTSTFLYKGKREQGLLGSRRSLWDETVAVIQEHPWLGVGFGTSKTGDEETLAQPTAFESEAPTTREHGSSYLAITEWVGLLGDVPFLFLLLLVVTNIGRVVIALRRSGGVASPVVPVAMVVAAGLVHAAFEDWLFAVGYYLCVLFWSFAFILVDLAPRAVAPLAAAPAVPVPWLGYRQTVFPADHASVS
jgi:hypothetical protein